MKKIYTKEEIEKLPLNFKESKKNIILNVLTIVISLIGLIMLGLGILFLIINDEPAFVLLITFGAMVLIMGLFMPLFKENNHLKIRKFKKELIDQAISESFGGQIIYDPYSSVDTNILKECDICPFEVLNGGEKLLITKNNKNLSIVEVTSASNLNELIGFILAAPELGVVGSAFIGIYETARKIKDKSIVSNKFKGTIMVFPNIKKEDKNIVEVRSTKFLTPLSSLFSSKQKFDTEDIVANKKFNFYSNDVLFGFKFIKPLMIETIKKLDEMLNKGYVMVFKDDYLIFAFMDESIDIKDLLKNKKVTPRKAYEATKDKLKLFDNIVSLILKNFYI